MSNQEEVELRAKIEALGLEVTKVPEQPANHLSEVNADALISCIIVLFTMHHLNCLIGSLLAFYS
jgi:hypothetical protein